jgi:peptidoglycan/xylan/chitin deacetylase (PgdA/CDA1 family)
VNTTGATTDFLDLTDVGLTSNSITLQSGVVNRITGTFTINNTSGAAAKVILNLEIRHTSSNDSVGDLMGQMMVRVPTGTSVWNLGFAVPRYLPSGAYDVLWYLENPNFTGRIDTEPRFEELTITNPSVIPNKGIPILMYHNVNASTPGGNWVAVVRFIGQMDYLASNGWTTIDGNDIYNYIYKGTPLPLKPVWLTFDDSYQNIYDYAYPIMDARGLQGSIFSVTQYMGQMNSWDLGIEPQHMHMTWNMLQQMKADGQYADGHTRHHVRLYELTDAEQQVELWGNQRDLTSFLGDPGKNFSYPYGQYPDSAKWLLAHSGFKSATIIGQVKQYTNYADMFELTRIGISDADDPTSFANKLNQP